MANTKISELATLSAAASADIFSIVDVSANATKGITVANLAPAGLKLFVDSVRGVDANGARGVSAAPFLTLTAAKAAAQSGDTVFVGPGSHALSTNLLKNGVNWHFEAGAIVTRTGTGAVFDDSAAGANGAVTCKITGSGVFNSATAGIVYLTNASSNVVFEADTASTTQATPGFEAMALFQTGGTLFARVRHLYSLQSPYYWENGESYVEAELVEGPGAQPAIYVLNTVTPTGQVWFRAKQILGYIECTSTQAARVWIDAMIVDARGNAGGGSSALLSGGVFLYLTCKKIIGGDQDAAPTIQLGFFDAPGGQVYLRCDKISPAGSIQSPLVLGSSGTSFLTVGELEESEGECDPNAMVRVTGGTHQLSLQSATRSISSSAGTVLEATGGTITVEGRLNAASHASGVPVQLSGGDVRLRNAELIAGASSNSVVAATARNLRVYGTVVANKAKHANVTLLANTGGLVVSTDVT